MSGNTMEPTEGQQYLFETESTRSLVDQLLSDSRLYTKSKDYKELLDFVVRMIGCVSIATTRPRYSLRPLLMNWRTCSWRIWGLTRS